jgi:large subunit ribosomal protein L4e
MFAALRTWRRWHRLVNVDQRRFAICSALAASSVPALVSAKGHKINRVPEFPLVVADDVEQIKKTKEAVALLKAIHAYHDVESSANSHSIRHGQGKMRNRRYVQKRGVLVVSDKNEGLGRALRNISGVDIANVNRLNILHLAPGGFVGRFIVWTEGAFKKLDLLYGTRFRNANLKKGYKHPTPEMRTTDLRVFFFYFFIFLSFEFNF